MTVTDATQPKLPGWLGPFASRPRLVAAIAFGGLVSLLLAFVPAGMRTSTRMILAWDAGALFFLISVTGFMRSCSAERIRLEAARQDEGQHFILGLVLLAASVSLGAIAIELSSAKSAHGLERELRIALAFVTIALSWFLVQVVFALHYAHEYYSPESSAIDKDGNGVVGGLGFLDSSEPDYWDFLHFAVVIGVASQTADVAFKTKSLRRLGTIQSIVSFLFNTVVLALTINLLAGLF